MKKKRVLINTDYLGAKTGLGRNGKELALYLYKTNKYEVIYYSCGMAWDHPEYARWPFKVYGTLPNTQQEIDALNRDPNQARSASYGGYNIDRVLKEAKPDVLVISNDSWSQDKWWEKPWWDKINVIPQVTLDSVPFLPDQVEYIQKSKNFTVWADFAVRESQRLGFNHVQRLTGMISDRSFYRLPDGDKAALRTKYNIPLDAFICGFVFRNQLRKELKPLMEGFALFLKENPASKAYLLLHTSLSEGWDIPRLAAEIGIPLEKILITYICENCGEFEIKHVQGQDLNCRFCGSEKSQTTTNVGIGCTEAQLNEVYNLMDCYCHLFNAGGLEIPIIESLYCELPTATVDYSSGETFTAQPFVTAIDFSWSVQHGTQFKRSCPYPSSVHKFLKKIYNMPKDKRVEIGIKSREWALQNFSIESVGKLWEEMLDKLPNIDYDFNFDTKPKNPHAVIPDIKDDVEWVKTLYKEILNMEVGNEDEGLKQWIYQLKNGAQRNQVHSFFVETAFKENDKLKKTDFGDTLAKNGKKRVIVALPESSGDCLFLTSLLPSLRRRYPSEEWDLYIATKPEYKSIFGGNQNVDYVIDYIPQMDNLLFLEGQHENKGYFDIAYLPHLGSQRMLNYLHNGICKIDFKIKE